MEPGFRMAGARTPDFLTQRSTGESQSSTEFFYSPWNPVIPPCPLCKKARPESWLLVPAILVPKKNLPLYRLSRMCRLLKNIKLITFSWE